MPDQRARQRLIIPYDGHEIGQGFNTDTFERVGRALTAGREGENRAADGQTAAFKFQMVTTQSSLEKALNFNAEVDVRYGLLSVGAKFGFAESSAVNTSSTYIIASCIVGNALRSGSQFQPTPEANRLIRAGDMEGFKRAYGDRFTEALRTGGEFYALVRITSADSTTQRKISASLHGELNGLVAGGSFKAAFEQSERQSSSKTEVEIQVHQTAGIGAQVRMPGTEADEIKRHMNRFATAVHEHPRAFEAEVVTYDTLALDFPAVLDLEDKRRVLEDCAARKRKYWTALSDIAFAQSEAAEFVFARLPRPEELAALDAEFRRILNEVMTHARAVSAGIAEPVLYVPRNEPLMPRFKRRNATSFAMWWARRNEPDLLADEKTLFTRILNEAKPLLAAPPGDDTSPDTVERAVDQIKRLDVSFLGAMDNSPPLKSLEVLPKMLDASSLEHLSANDTHLADLHGLEDFTRLESLDIQRAKLEDLAALKGCAGLKSLYMPENKLRDLSPLKGLLGLETLVIGGNEVSTLEPIKGLKALRVLGLAQGRLQMRSENEPPPPFVLLDNRIEDARALEKLPQLANPFVGTDTIRIRRFKERSEELVDEGEAVRIGNSNRFKVQFGNAAQETMLLMACVQTTILDISAEPFVMVAVHFPDTKKCGIAFTEPGKPRSTMSAAQVKAALGSRHALGLAFSIGLVAGLAEDCYSIEATTPR
jgi:hypothetical protein